MENEPKTELRETVTPAHTTVIHEKRGSGGIMIAVIAVVALLVGAFIYMRGQDSEVMRDAAISDAAQKVGESAQQAGEAIEDAASKVAPE